MKTILLLLLVPLIAMLPCYANNPELNVRTGHNGTVCSIAFSPDGKTLASGSVDTTVKLWDVASGKEVGALYGHDDQVYSVAWSPDGKVLASGSNDGQIKLWDPVEYKLTRTMKPGGSVKCVAFSPDGKTLASGAGRTLFLWNVATGRQLCQHETSSAVRSKDINFIETIAWTSDGKILAEGSWENTVTLWDVSSCKSYATLASNPARSLTFSSDDKTLVVGTTDGSISFWDVLSKRQLSLFPAHKRGVATLGYSRDNKSIASGGGDDAIKLWEVSSNKELMSFPLKCGYSRALAISPDGTMLAGADREAIKIWDARSGKELEILGAHSNRIDPVACSTGSCLASGTTPNIITMWALRDGLQIHNLAACNETTESIAFSPDGKMLALQGYTPRRPQGEESSTIQFLDAKSGLELRQIKGDRRSEPLTWSPDGTKFANICGTKGNLNVYDAKSGAQVHTQADCSSYAWAPDNKRLMLGTSDGTIDLWDVVTWRPMNSFVGYSGWLKLPECTHRARGVVGQIACSPDGKTFATEFNGEIKLWNATSCKLIRSLYGKSGKPRMGGALGGSKKDGAALFFGSQFYCMSFSSDSKSLITTSDQRRNAIIRWDVASGKVLQELKGHTATIKSALLTADGKMVVSSSIDTTIRLWNAASGSELAKLLSFGLDDWVVVTPDGRFDATPGAMKMLYWRDGHHIVEANEIGKQFYVPGLLQKTINALYSQPN
jgi:WD40 repeat protein